MVRGTALNHISLHTSMCKLGTVLTRLEPYLGREEMVSSTPEPNIQDKPSFGVPAMLCHRHLVSPSLSGW